MPGRSLSLPFVGDLLRDVRERHGLTQKQLADRCCAAGYQLSRSSVAGYEANDRKPRPDTLQALVAGFAGLPRQGRRKPVSVEDFLARPRKEPASG